MLQKLARSLIALQMNNLANISLYLLWIVFFLVKSVFHLLLPQTCIFYTLLVPSQYHCTCPIRYLLAKYLDEVLTSMIFDLLSSSYYSSSPNPLSVLIWKVVQVWVCLGQWSSTNPCIVTVRLPLHNLEIP